MSPLFFRKTTTLAINEKATDRTPTLMIALNINCSWLQSNSKYILLYASDIYKRFFNVADENRNRKWKEKEAFQIKLTLDRSLITENISSDCNKKLILNDRQDCQLSQTKYVAYS